MASLEKVFDAFVKLLCMLVLVGQAVALDSYFFKLDYSGTSAYLWVVLDVVVILCWLLSLLMAEFTNATKMEQRSLTFRIFTELRYAYLSWVVYAIILCFKINHMFFYFAEVLVAKPDFYSSTSLKLIISLAGVAFLLLVYCHHKEIKDKKYKLIMEKISMSACLDVLDCLSLLNILFVNDGKFDLSYRLDRTIRAFSCICILLPVFPLIVLRVLQGYSSTKKWNNGYTLSLIMQTSLYFIFVNLPLFSIRTHLWIVHEIDISTFFTKNVIMLFKGAFDIIKEAIDWYKKRNKREKDADRVDGQEDGNMLQERAMADEKPKDVEVSEL